MSDADYDEPPQLFRLTLKDGEEPADGGYHEAFVVCAETERKAWSAVVAYLKQDGEEDEHKGWLKGARRVNCEHLGSAFDTVPLGILVLSYIPA